MYRYAMRPVHPTTDASHLPPLRNGVATELKFDANDEAA